LYIEGDFIQTIEGSDKSVNSLYAKILKDKRHTQIMKVGEGYTVERQFENWSMSGLSLSYEELQVIDGFKSYDRSILFSPSNASTVHPAIKIMEAITPIVNEFKGI